MKPVNIILILIMFLGFVFEMIPEDFTLIQPFLLVDDKQYQQGHIYFILEHLRYIAVVGLLLTRPEPTTPIKVFLALSFLDMAEYLISNNEWIYFVGSFQAFGYKLMLPFSFNLIQLVVLCTFVIIDEIKND